MHILITDSGVGGLSVCAYAERFVREHGFREPVRLTFANAAPENDYGYNSMPSREAKLQTFDRFLTYPSGSNDFFGFGSGSRGIPSAIGDNRLVQGAFDAAQLQTFGRAFSDVWQPTSTSSQRPALDWSINGGHTIGKFGFVGALSFSNKPQVHKETLRFIRQNDNTPFIFTEYPDFKEYSESARLGAIFNTALKLTPSHKFIFRNTFTHEAEKEAREFSGYDGGVGGNLQSQRLHFVERSLFSTGVEGDAYRATVIGPGVSPLVRDEFSPPPPFNRYHYQDLRAWLVAPTLGDAAWR